MKTIKATAFIILEIILYGLLLWDKNVDTAKVCYASIAVCLFYTAISITDKTDSVFVCCGLLFSLLADTFLVLMRPADYYMGVVLFSVVQTVYMLRIIVVYEGNNVVRMIHFAAAAIFTLTMVNSVWTVFGPRTDKLKLLATAYFALFVIDVVFAFVNVNKNPLFAVGMLMFLCCDFIIGMQYIDSLLPFAADTFFYKLTHTAINLPWVFYLPGQVMISLNTNRIDTRTRCTCLGLKG